MLTFLVLTLVFLVFVAVVSRAASQSRRARAVTAQHRSGGARPGSGTASGGPFEVMVGQHSYRLDERTGRWVETTHEKPDRPWPGPLNPEAAAHKRAKEEAAARAAAGLVGPDGTGELRVRPAAELPTFADVGGMDELKQELRDTVGLLIEHPHDAARYGIEWNGLLLHGPAGVGKTFLAKATAGEFGLNLIHVSTGDLVSSLVGGSARNIENAFRTAAANLPCVLFFDEFDSVAQRRDSTPDQEMRRTVNQLLTSLETHREERRLLVMAATNSVEHLDPAAIRPGRFDRHIRIDLPDADARRAIFRAELRDRPTARRIELDTLVARTEGMTPAAIEKVVDTAALDVFREAARTGRVVELETEHLVAALDRHGGRDRPTVEHWTWESLVLDPAIKAQLQQLQAVIENPEAAERYGIDPPAGLLLAGPPGTGKTSIARVLAAQARCSFYPISGADVMSKWLGESERNISRLFERAQENRPSIVFVDEIDAIASRRGTVETQDSQVNQLLTEIDGVAGRRGVFVIGATNRPDQLDPALLRGGRLSRTIVLGLPDEAGRLEILRLFTARMPTVAVDLEALARATDGLSPADLKALCQEAALAAMTNGGGDPAVRREDFEEALVRLRPEGERRRVGFA